MRLARPLCGTLLVTVALAACSSSSNPGTSGASIGASGSGAGAGTTAGAATSGATGGSATGTGAGTASAGAGATGSGSAAGGTTGSTGSSDVTLVGTVILPQVPVEAAYNPTTDEIWVTTEGHNDAGLAVSSISVIDNSTFTLKQTLAVPGLFSGVAVSPTLNKVYVSNGQPLDGGFGAELLEIDGVTHVAKTVELLPFGDEASLVASPTASTAYASYGEQLDVIDCTTDSVTATILPPDGGLLGSFGRLSIDPVGGGTLYANGGDKNFYPVLATIDTVSRIVTSAIGGQDAGWKIAVGVAALPDAGVAAITPKIGEAFLQFVDPTTINLPAGYVPTSIAAVFFRNPDPDSNRWLIAVMGSFPCGDKVLILYDAFGELVGGTRDFSYNLPSGTVKLIVTGMVEADPLPPTNGIDRLVLTLSQAPGQSGGGDTVPPQIYEINVNVNALVDAGMRPDAGC